MTKESHPVLSELEGLFLRWLAALALVFGTYNPSGFNYIQWVRDASTDTAPYLIFVGLMLFIGYAVFLRASWHSLGPWGLALLIALTGSALLSLSHLGLLNLKNHNVLTYSVLITLATVMALGLDWSIIRRRLSGQIDVES